LINELPRSNPDTPTSDAATTSELSFATGATEGRAAGPLATGTVDAIDTVLVCSVDDDGAAPALWSS